MTLTWILYSLNFGLKLTCDQSWAQCSLEGLMGTWSLVPEQGSFYILSSLPFHCFPFGCLSIVLLLFSPIGSLSYCLIVLLIYCSIVLFYCSIVHFSYYVFFYCSLLIVQPSEAVLSCPSYCLHCLGTPLLFYLSIVLSWYI
jgi:hypothetical protein